VTAEDVQRVARQYFVTNTRNLAFEFQPPTKEAPPAAAGASSGAKQ